MCNCFVFVAYSTDFFYYEVKQTRRPSGHQATNNGLSLHLVAFFVSVSSKKKKKISV